MMLVTTTVTTTPPLKTTTIGHKSQMRRWIKLLLGTDESCGGIRSLLLLRYTAR
jgi:hypothetical protein